MHLKYTKQSRTSVKKLLPVTFITYINSIHYKVKEIIKWFWKIFFLLAIKHETRHLICHFHTMITIPWLYRAHYIIDRQQYLTYKITNPVISAHDNVLYNLNEETRAQRWRPKRERETLTLRRWKSGTGPCADPRSYSTPPLSRKPPPSGAESLLLQVCFV